MTPAPAATWAYAYVVAGLLTWAVLRAVVPRYAPEYERFVNTRRFGAFTVAFWPPAAIILVHIAVSELRAAIEGYYARRRLRAALVRIGRMMRPEDPTGFAREYTDRITKEINR